MAAMSTTDARQHFAELVNRSAYGKERVLLTHHGRTLAAVVPLEDLELLEALEDKRDLGDMLAAEQAAKRRGEKPIPWSKARKLLR